MATEVSVRDITTGDQTYYSTYADALAVANDYDVISIYANLNEQIILRNNIDVYISPGTIINYSGSESTIITEEGKTVECNITGGGIIRNSATESRASCIEINDSDSQVNIECFSIEGFGDESGTTGASTIIVNASKRFSLNCDRIFNRYNTAVQISGCNDFFMKVRTIEAGDLPYYNQGAPVMVIEGSGSIYINELNCWGLGSCLQLKDGTLAATINKISTLVFDPESPATNPSVLLSDGTGSQELVLYFDEIRNLNPNGADCFKMLQGKASLIGRKIYSESSKTLVFGDNTHTITSAFIQCDEIISLLEGIDIWNSTEPVVIDANYIEGSNANDGVVKCHNSCNVVLRNAKIKNTYNSTLSPYSIGIYITSNTSPTQHIELENLIIVVGDETNDFSIYRDGSTNINIRNLLLFVNKGISNHITFIIGDQLNFKYIEDPSIS